MGADAAQINKPVNRPQQVIPRDVLLQRELVKTMPLALPALVPSSQNLQPFRRIEPANGSSIKKEPFNKIRS